jgi:hypothetical protein
VAVGPRTYRVLDRLANGSICSLYRCQFTEDSRQVECIFKIASDPRTNRLVTNEADVLRRLHALDIEQRFTPFLPTVQESFAFADDSPTPRQANILRMHEAIGSPDELYTLTEVKSCYPAGLDSRHVAWIWRRLLTVLGFAHTNDVVHCAILPAHILIEPREHKLILVDWCAAQHEPHRIHTPPAIISGSHMAWYKRQGGTRTPPTPALDIGLAARSMIDLLGGDPVGAHFPAGVAPALQRHFQRCLGTGPASHLDAHQLLDDFDRLIEVLWGPRKFAILTLPPKTHRS